MIKELTELKGALDKVRDIINDKNKVKEIMKATFDIAVHGTNSSMKTGGWETLIRGSNNNEKLQELFKNSALYVYTQVLIILVAHVLMKEQNENNKSGDQNG